MLFRILHNCLRTIRYKGRGGQLERSFVKCITKSKGVNKYPTDSKKEETLIELATSCLGTAF